MGRPKKEPTEFKTCKKCRKRKHSTEFYATSSQCKPCHSKTVKKNQKRKKNYYNEYRTEYALKHPDKVALWNKQFIANWEEKHGMKYKDYALEQHNQRKVSDPAYMKRVSRNAKRTREKNKEKIAERRRQYYLKNREAIMKKEKMRYEQNRTKCVLTQKIYRTKTCLQKAIEKNNSVKIKALIEKLNTLYQQQATINNQQKSI